MTQDASLNNQSPEGGCPFFMHSQNNGLDCEVRTQLIAEDECVTYISRWLLFFITNRIGVPANPNISRSLFSIYRWYEK